MATYTAEQQKIIDDAMSGAAVSSLSPEAQYYRAYGQFPTTTQTQQQTQLSQTAPGYVLDTRDYGAGSTSELIGVPGQKTEDYKPLEEGRKTMQEQLAAGELASPQKIEEAQQGVDTGRPSPQTVQAQPFTQGPGGVGAIPSPGAGGTAFPGGATGGIPGSKFQQGAAAVKSAGIQAPGTAAGGAALVEQYAPMQRNDLASMFVKTDPYLDQLVNIVREYFSPDNQRETLRELWEQGRKDTGVEDIDLELVNMKNVIEGSEDDIRTEITKAGGFATESQILALTNARNKQLIKNYNKLVDVRNAKEKYLETSIQLEIQDRQAADQRFESLFNMGMQITQLRQQMQQNTVQRMQWLSQTLGFDGLYNSTGGDPYYTSMIEQSLGLAPGGLAQAAQQAEQTKLQAEEERQLDLKIKQLQITKLAQDINAPTKLSTQIVDVNGRKFLVNTQTGETIREIAGGPDTAQDEKRLDSLDTITTLDQLQTHSGLDNAVGPSFFTRMFGRLTGNRQDFIGKVQQIVDQYSLESLISAKSRGATFGALSDNELRVLASAATTIGTWAMRNKSGEITGYNISEKAFRDEIDTINSLTRRAYILSGFDPQDVDVIQTDDGKLWMQGWDGSLIEVYRP